MNGQPSFIRHLGASFVAGLDLVHAWFRSDVPEPFLEQWRALEILGLATRPQIQRVAPDAFHAAASVYPHLPLRIIASCFASRSDAERSEALSSYAHDAASFRGSYALHRREALALDWPAHPARFGRYVGTLFGMGQFHRVGVMNVSAHVPMLADLVGGRKCAGRDWLEMMGLPTPPGGLADDPDAAVTIAERVGWPVVLKRPIGGNGDGVALSIADAASCREAAVSLLNGHPHIVVERMLDGLELRAHLVNGRIFEIRRVVHRTIRPDGAATLAALIEHQHPEFWRTITSAEWMRRRVVMVLWRYGVRCFDDLMRIVPAAGTPVRIASGVQIGSDGIMSVTTLHRQDRKSLETAFESIGSPSGGVDIVLPKAGARLADGGGILEINIPCGMGYLSDPAKAAQAELDAWIAESAGFRRARGRVPFIVAPKRPDSRRPFGWSRMTRAAGRRYERAFVFDLAEAGGWLPALMSKADAILVSVSDKAALDYGLPLNSKPIYVQDGLDDPSTPVLDATIRNCGPRWSKAPADSVVRMLERR